MAIQKQVREFIEQSFYTSVGVADDASLIDTGAMDSTGVLEVISFLEERFHIQVGEREVTPDNFDSIRRITAFVERKMLVDRGECELATQAIRRALEGRPAPGGSRS